jgi:hypothetical protein
MGVNAASAQVGVNVDGAAMSMPAELAQVSMPSAVSDVEVNAELAPKFNYAVGSASCDSIESFNWTMDEEKEMVKILEGLGIDPMDFQINLDDLISEKGGKALCSENPQVKRMIELLQKGLGRPLGLGTHAAGERGGRGSSLRFVGGTVLAHLKIGNKQIAKVLDKPNLTTKGDQTAKDKSLILNQVWMADKGLEFMILMLEKLKREVEATMAAQPLAAQSSCKEQVKRIESQIEDMRQSYDKDSKRGKNLGGVVGLQALNSVDIEKIADPKKKDAALDRQRAQVRETIADESTWWKEKGERFFFSIVPMNENDKDHVADKLKGSDIRDRYKAHVFAPGSSDEMSERFYFRLFQMLANGTDHATIDRFIDASLRSNDDGVQWSNPQEANQLAFIGLLPVNRARLADLLKNMAHGFCHVRQNTQVGVDVRDNKDSTELCESFKTKFDSECASRFSRFETELKGDGVVAKIYPPVAPLIPQI